MSLAALPLAARGKKRTVDRARSLPGLLSLLLISALAPQGIGQGAPRVPGLVARQVAAPPADILSGLLKLPEPEAGAVRSRAALLAVDWTRADSATHGQAEWIYRSRLPLAAGGLGLALVGPGADRWEVQLRGPGRDLDLREMSGATVGFERRAQALEGELAGWSAQRFDVEQISSGIFEVILRSPQVDRDLVPGPGFLVVRDQSPLSAAAFLTTHARVAGRPIGINAQVELDGTSDADGGGLRGQVLAGVVTRALARVEGPFGEKVIELFDDGQHDDGAVGDGRFGGWLPRELSGQVQARIDLTGSWNGEPFRRTTGLVASISEPLLELTGRVSTEVEDANRLRLDLEALPLDGPRRVQVSAEVWGRDSAGQPVPIAWLSRMEEPVLDGGVWQLPLWLDAGWFAASRAAPPLELRGVRIQDPNHHAVLAAADRMAVPNGSLPPMAGYGVGTINASMLSGIQASSPLGPFRRRDVFAPNVQPGLMLTHGYCSSGTVWPDSDFSEPKLQFLDLNQNRSHDEFAQALALQGAGFDSFGVIGHSQGGPAALHLLTFYESPLDQAKGPRRIQSVGSPYQGTPLAALGFFACGVNDDLTPGGASLWLAGIPSAFRDEVYTGPRQTRASSPAACSPTSCSAIQRTEPPSVSGASSWAATTWGTTSAGVTRPA